MNYEFYNKLQNVAGLNETIVILLDENQRFLFETPQWESVSYLPPWASELMLDLTLLYLSINSSSNFLTCAIYQQTCPSFSKKYFDLFLSLRLFLESNYVIFSLLTNYYWNPFYNFSNNCIHYQRSSHQVWKVVKIYWTSSASLMLFFFTVPLKRDEGKKDK